jgi:GT2 family glycosyltransferase
VDRSRNSSDSIRRVTRSVGTSCARAPQDRPPGSLHSTLRPGWGERSVRLIRPALGQGGVPVHVLVLNYEGRDLLQKFFPSVVQGAYRIAQGACVSLVDNSSRDGSAEWVQDNFPSVGIWSCPNLGLASFNLVAERLSEPILILCNNDIRPEGRAFLLLVQALKNHEDVFAAGPMVFGLGSGELEGCAASLCYVRGLVRTVIRPINVYGAGATGRQSAPGLARRNLRPVNSERCGALGKRSAPGSHVDEFGRRAQRSMEMGCTLQDVPSAGVVAAVRRERFLVLGGYSAAYHPGRYEDLELCFRAWLRGWRTVCVPEAWVWHLGSATFQKQYPGEHLRELALRNALLFVWRNLTSMDLLVEHFAWLALRAAWAGLMRDRVFWRALAGAWQRQAKSSRPPVVRRCTDRAVLRKFA